MKIEVTAEVNFDTLLDAFERRFVLDWKNLPNDQFTVRHIKVLKNIIHNIEIAMEDAAK